MRHADVPAPGEEEFPELLYLLSLPTDVSAVQSTDLVEAVTPGSRQRETAKVGRGRHAEPGAHCNPVSHARAADRSASLKRSQKKDSGRSTVKCRPSGARVLRQWQTQQRLRQQRQVEPAQLQRCVQEGGGGQEPSQQHKELQRQREYGEQRLTISRNSTKLSAQERADIPSRCWPAPPAPAASSHQKPANDVAALQRRRREAAAAATAASKSQLEAYKQRRRLRAARLAAAQQEDMQKCRLGLLTRLRQHHAEQEQWRQQQEREGLLLLQLQQEIDHRQAERKMRQKLLQAARAAAAHRVLAAERAARAATAEDSGRRRACVKRMEQARAEAQRAKAAAALRRARSSEERARRSWASSTTRQGPASAETRAEASQDPRCISGGEKPRLLSTSTARRVALRQQMYSASFLHRLIVNQTADKLPREPSETTLTLESFAPSAAASCCVSNACNFSALSLEHDSRGDTRISHLLPFSKAHTSPPVSLAKPGRPTCSPGGRRLAEFDGEAPHELGEGGDTGERRLAMDRQPLFSARVSDAVLGGMATVRHTAGSEVPAVADRAARASPAVEAASASAGDTTLGPSGAREDLASNRRKAERDVRTPQRLQGEDFACCLRSSSCSTVPADASSGAAATARTTGEVPFRAPQQTLPVRPSAETTKGASASKIAPPGGFFGKTDVPLRYARASICVECCAQTPVRAGLYKLAEAGLTKGVDGCFGRATASVHQQETGFLLASLHNEGDSITEHISEGRPETPPSALSLPAHNSEEFFFAVTNEKQPERLADACVCHDLTTGNFCTTVVGCRSAVRVTGSDLERDSSACSSSGDEIPGSGDTQTTSPAAEKAETGSVPENALATAARWDNACGADNAADENLIIHSAGRITRLLPETESTHEHMSASGAPPLLHNKWESDCLSPTSIASASLAREGNLEVYCGGDCGGSTFRLKLAEREEWAASPSPSAQCLSVSNGEAKVSAASLVGAPHYPVVQCGDSPSASPHAYRPCDTPDFGLRLGSSSGDLKKSEDATTKLRSLRKQAASILQDNDRCATDGGRLHETRSQQCEPEKEEGPPEESRAHHGLTVRGNAHAKRLQESAQGYDQHRPDDGAPRGTRAAASTNREVSLCGHGATGADAACSQQPRSGLPASSAYSPSLACGAAAKLQESDHRGCSTGRLSDFSQRGRTQQQDGAQTSKHDCRFPLLQQHSLLNQLNFLCSSTSSSSDLNTSNGSCCCDTLEAGEGRRYVSTYKNRAIAAASDQIACVSRAETVRSAQTLSAADTVHERSTDATEAPYATSSARLPSHDARARSRDSVVRQYEGRQRWHDYLRVPTLSSEAAGEQISDGADADAESDSTSADEPRASLGRHVEQHQEETPKYPRESRKRSLPKRAVSCACALGHEADPTFFTEGHEEGRSPGPTLAAIARVTKNVSKNTGNDDNARAEAGDPRGAGEVSVPPSTDLDAAKSGLTPGQRVTPLPCCSDETDTTGRQDDAATRISDRTSRLNSPKRTEETLRCHQRTELQIFSSPSEQRSVVTEGAGSAPGEDCRLPGPHVLSSPDCAGTAEGCLAGKRHGSHQQGGLLAPLPGNRLLCGIGAVQQMADNQCPGPTAADFGPDTGGAGPACHGQTALADLLNEFLDVDSVQE